MSDPRISVLMSVHNGERFLREAVDSILNQTYTNFEFIIFDDCSTDSSLAILQSYTDPRICIIKNEKNLGLTESLNKGLSLARGELIARMDADDISLPTRFEKQVVFLDQHPEVAVVGTWMECIDARGQTFSHVKMPIDPDVIHAALLKNNCLAHPSVLFRKEPIITVGGYQNTAGKYAQDYDLWLRLSDRYRLANLPEYLLQYRFHNEQVSLKKLHSQTKTAQTYRRLAAQRRIEHGEVVDLSVTRDPNWLDQLKGAEGAVGKTYFWMGMTYEAMGETGLARRTHFKALMHSPLSATIWEKILLDIILGRVLSDHQKKALRWYSYRLQSLLQGNRL